MKIVILAGGLGSRLGEETGITPKPMVKIGDYPILWHIMKIYSYYGFNDFVILTGYKQECIVDYFINYHRNNSDLTIDLLNDSIYVHKSNCEPWKVTLLNTGLSTLTAGRIKRAYSYLKDDRFMLTYGDGVSNLNVTALLEQHVATNKICTLTAYQPEGRYGSLDVDSTGTVNSFLEKPKEGGAWINSGFMVCEPSVFDYLPEDSDNIMFEKSPLQKIANDGKLGAYKHVGFWHPMDMLKDKVDLNKMWESGKAPWKIWKD